ncbi:unnamed protein product [Urochloa decumbens]|uniref:Uncharacterized protein n=1 Tax=Urochloa decumbens TaxID=240449 RepID=A0ABC9CS31_9POAL
MAIPSDGSVTRRLSKIRTVDMCKLVNSMKNELDYYQSQDVVDTRPNSCLIYKIQQHICEMLLLDGCFILVALGGVRRMVERRMQEVARGDDLQEIVVDNGKESTGSCTAGNMMNEETSTQKMTPNPGGTQESVDKKGSQLQYGSGQWFIIFINHDLFLLENQIPFFIIHKIYDLLSSDGTDDISFTVDIVQYVEAALRSYPKAVQESERPKDFHHLLHLCHMYFRPSQNVHDHHHLDGSQYIHKFLRFGRKYLKLGQLFEENDEQGVYDIHDGMQLNRWRRAVQYIEAGVKFQKREFDCDDPHSLLDIKFKHGVMEIPCIFVDEYTEFLFRNLIAFEQTCPQFGDDFTAYTVFLSQLVSMPEDVTILGQKGIIVHHLDCDATVSDLFTMLSKDVVFDFNCNYYLKTLCQKLEAHYQSNLNRWMAWLWLNHFSNPWLGLGAIATAIVLFCTIVQTVYGILAYMNM